MTSREARGGSRRRSAVLAASAIALIAIPVAVGFRMAQAGAVTYRSGTQDSVVIVTDPSGTATDLPDVVDASNGQEPVTIEDALTPRPDELTESRITWLRADGRTVPVRNGGSISLGGGVEVRITVDPYPPVDFDPGDVDFVVTRDGVPVEGAAMSLTYDMRFMAHGPFPVDLGTGTAGAFSFTYQPFMFGPWQIDATLTLPGSDSIQFSISLYVWPNS